MNKKVALVTLLLISHGYTFAEPTPIKITLPEKVELREVVNTISMPIETQDENFKDLCLTTVTLPKFQYELDMDKPAGLIKLEKMWFERGLRSMKNFLDMISEKGSCVADYSGARDLSVGYSFTGQFGNFVSMIFTTYEFSGGAHGNGGDESSLIDLNTGKEVPLGLEAFLKPQYSRKVMALIEAELKKNENFIIEENSGWEEFKKKDLAQIKNFYLNDKGVVVFFNPYDIGPYAAGSYEVLLTWESLATFKSKTDLAKLLPNK